MSVARLAFDMTPALVSPAGVGRYASGIASALERRPDIEVTRIASARSEAGGRLGRLARGLKREGLYYPMLLGSRARRAGAQLVHCPAPYGARTGALPLVLSAHDVLPLSHPELFTRAITAHMRHVSARRLRTAQRVLCGSEHVRGELVDMVGVDPDRIDVTPYGVGPAFRPAAAERGDPYVLCVGTLEPRKNLAGALRAFAHAAPPDVRLVIAGDRGWHNAEFERELERHRDRVTMAGRVSQERLVRLYSGAVCFLFPSLGEGFGFPVLEAMACGAPVVTSDNTSIPELAGGAALLVDPTDDEAIADALGRLLGDRALADRLSERGLARSAAFSWEACAEATVAAYLRALE